MPKPDSEITRTEQIISQFFLKTLQSILSSRIPHLSGSPSLPRRSDRWFNLPTGHPPHSSHQTIFQPMILDIILSPRDPLQSTAVIERWTTHCNSSSSSSSSSSSLYKKTYKKCILLLRSIYSLLRLLPAYRAFRLLSSSSQPFNYDLSYKVSSIVEPFEREEEKGFQLQTFSSVESQLGCLSVSVQYRNSLEGFNLEVCAALPPTLIIADYVGSPAADSMRAFPASAMRPHSCPSSSSSPPDCFGRRISITRQIGGCRKGFSDFSSEEYRMSPPFSASPTPSPPTHRVRLGTAPVSIPQQRLNHRTPNFSDPTRSLLPPPSPRSARGDVCLEESHSARSFRRLDALKVGNLHSLLYTAPKVLKDAKDDSGRFSSVLSSCGSPRFVSRSSSRKSLQDDLEDFDFSCPFAVDDVDIFESQIRHHDSKDALEFAQASSPHGSQDAAVGALVHMLKTAPSLREDQSLSSQSSKSEVNSEASTCSFFSSRKKSDALEELRGYRDMKQVILSKSRIHMLDPQNQATE